MPAALGSSRRRLPRRSVLSDLRSDPQRVGVFVDGANFYHALRALRIRAADVDIEKVAIKLARERPLAGVYYFIARLDRGAGSAHAANRRLLEDLSRRSRVRLFLGFIQRQRETDPCATALRDYLRSADAAVLPKAAHTILAGIAQEHETRDVYREKGVDVALAVELVRQARDDEFDLAFLVSGDGDFYPAVDLARRMGKRVIAAGPVVGRRLREACDATLRLDREWFGECSR